MILHADKAISLHINEYSESRLRTVALLLVFCSALFANRAFGQDETRVTFSNSIGALPTEVVATKRTLALTQQTTDTMEFGVALRMRDFAAFEARVARGEIIPREELERVYLPLQSDYDAVVQWLKDQGFTITLQDNTRLGVYARGTVAQIQSALQTTISGVTVNGVNYNVATTSPSLPASIAKPVLGINNLQPFRHRNKHSVRRPLVNHAAPFLTNEILTAYNATNLGVTGAGQTIGILIDTPPLNSDLTQFWTANGVSQSLSNITTINVNNVATYPAREGEESLDAEWTSGIAPGAKIRVYATGSLEDASLDKGFQRLITDLQTDPTIHQFSISLGLGESYSASSQLDTDHQLLTTIASQGVSTFVSSGDDGSTPLNANSSTAAYGPVQVEYYSSDPSVTAVGGTSLTLNSSNARTSEVVWGTGPVGIATASATGGGISAYFARPNWQTGANLGQSTAKRLVPDVSLPADPNTGAYVVQDGKVYTIGGTSWSAPTWAGLCALINEGRARQSKPAMGLLNPSVYPLLSTTNFFDITSGSNAVTAAAKTANKYSATAGYDLTTGIGSPNMSVLFNTLVNQSVAAPTISGFTASGAVGANVVITGLNFTSPTAVLFNGTNANYTVDSTTQITAVVPSGATNGPISVSTLYGTTVSSTNFTVTASSATGAVVISQIYGAGGNASAIYTNDYIELFNPGTSAVNLGAYSVQYASASGATFSVTNLSGSIQPLHYYLVQESSGGSIGTALPTPNATGTLNMSATTGKVALVSNQTAITSKTSTGVVDFVGFGGATEYEGSVGPAAAPSTSTATFRLNGGVTDTNDNKADFVAAAPNPRNASSPGAPDLTIAKTHSGSFTQADSGDTYAITVSNVGAGPTSGTVSVTETLPAGLTATAFSGSGWTVTPGSLTATRTDALATGAAYPALTLTVNVSSTAAASVTNAVSVSLATDPNAANNSASDVTAITALTPSQSWRYRYFGSTANSGAAADTAVAAGDGLTNLLKYALNLNPLVPAVVPATTDKSSGFLSLSVPKNPAATDVTFSIEATGDLTTASSWSVNNVTVDQNTSTLLQAHDKTPISAAAPGQYIRLRVTRP